MKRIAASAGQLARTNVASSALGAVQSPSQCTAIVDRRPGGVNIALAPCLAPQLDAVTSVGTALTRAVAT
jgi:hypothetical protein